MRKYIDAAKIVGRKNLDGRLAVASTAGLPFLLQEGMRVHFVPPVLDAPREAEVLSVSTQGEDSAIVSFDCVGNASDADALVGCHCLVERDLIDRELLDELEASELPDIVGWTIRDLSSGLEGTILDVMEMPGQTMLSVSLSNGDGRERLVPLVEDFVVEVDEEARMLLMFLPKGIFEL